jgi:hypothetical protein
LIKIINISRRKFYMKYGIREICDVVFRAKSTMTVGDKVFYKHEPVIYFDSLKTSSLEGAATTVYAQGGRGNSRLAAWEGEKTVTFTMEDALISTLGLAILTGAGVMDATESKSIIQHVMENGVSVKQDEDDSLYVELDNAPYAPEGSTEHFVYVMITDASGEATSEPYIFKPAVGGAKKAVLDDALGFDGKLTTDSIVLVDYYTERKSNAKEITITPSSFGGNFYVEASTLFRDAATGKDMPAEFIIPNAKLQSNFTFTMASSGDPSTFTFTMDAFPDYTRFNRSEKVFSAIQIIENVVSENEDKRTGTVHGTTKA